MMRQLLLYLVIFLGTLPGGAFYALASGPEIPDGMIQKKEEITPMEALDEVKEHFAANFDKVYYNQQKDEYYYKSTIAGYYLAYEGEKEAGGDYLIHLYEYVSGDEETGLGHTVTYGWFRVDRYKKTITELTD